MTGSQGNKLFNNVHFDAEVSFCTRASILPVGSVNAEVLAHEFTQAISEMPGAPSNCFALCADGAPVNGAASAVAASTKRLSHGLVIACSTPGADVVLEASGTKGPAVMALIDAAYLVIRLFTKRGLALGAL